MILSASRRTDIPAFYSEWFINRIKAGYLCVRNPMNIHQASRISPLNPDTIDGIVFWSKNPAPMIKHLDELAGYTYYFQFTLNAYSQDIEPNLPCLDDRIRTLQALSRHIGHRRVIWRYDPILFTDRYTLEFHAEAFSKLAARLSGYTDSCVISFLDRYRHIAAGIRVLGIEDDNDQKQRVLAEKFSLAAKGYGLSLETCAEKIDLSEFGIGHSHCIDKARLEELGHFTLKIGKDKNQRKECGCFESVDVGEYDTCRHGCIYCYATRRRRTVDHDPESPFLHGRVQDGDRITERRAVSQRDNQTTLLFPE